LTSKEEKNIQYKVILIKIAVAVTLWTLY